MKLKQYSIYQISARTILSCARKTEDGYRFYFDLNDETNQPVIQKTMQDDCAMFHQLLPLTDVPGEPALPEEDKLLSFLVYLDFTGIFDRKPTGQVKELQELAEWLFRPEGIEFVFWRGPVAFRAFERSASMSRNNRLSFVRADLYDTLWKQMTLGMQIGSCQLSKLYAYNGLMFTSGQKIDKYSFHMDADHIIVVDNPRSIVKNVPIITVEDDGSKEPMRRYTRVEKISDIEVLEFDGEGLISAELGYQLDPYGGEEHDHHSFQIRMPYIKGVVHEVDFHALFEELGVTEIVDIEGVRHPVSQVDMILTKSMCKGWGWMKENGLSWREHLDRCRKYKHRLYISNMDRRGRDGLTELNFQLLNTAAITAEEYRPHELPMGWEESPEAYEQVWLTKATETAYYNAVANQGWQLSYFGADRNNPELDYDDPRRLHAELLHKNPAFLQEQVFQKELADKARQIREKYGIGKLQVSGDTRFLSDDLMRLLAIIVRPSSEQAYRFLKREFLHGAEIYAPQPSYPEQELLTILRNPHISRNEEALVTPLSDVGSIRKRFLSHLYYVAMVDSRSLIPDRLGGADYDGDTVHLYAEPMLCRSILRNYDGKGLKNEHNLPLLKIPSAEPLFADANDWRARFETVKSTFSSRIGQISNAALRRSILAYDEATPETLREQCREETEILTILTGLEIDSAKSGIKPDLSEYLGHQARVRSLFLRYKEIADEPDEHEWYEPTKKLKTFFDGVEWDEVTANLERTPLYARELGKQTKPPKAKPAKSEELFTFARNPDWKEHLDPHTMERMRSIIADYEEARRRCEMYRHRKPSKNYRKDIQRILFSQDRENEISVDELYDAFSYMESYDVHSTLENLRASSWQFTPEKDRLLMLYTVFSCNRLPFCRGILCDFRCGGYRILGDILIDLDEQMQDAKIRKHKGIRKDDTEQMKHMMLGVMDSQDYRETLIRNCKSIIHPTIRRTSVEELDQLDWDEAVKCAEALGKRAFILEVMPHAALDLTIDRNAPEEKKGVMGVVERMGRIFGIHKVS